MAEVRKVLIRRGVQLVLHVSAWLARAPAGWRRRASAAWSHALAQRAIRRGRIHPDGLARNLPELGEAWQRAFPARKQIPIMQITADTVYAEIRTPCPLRGSGDTHACHRMMAFDRQVAAAAGGSFTVLRSQAEPGVTICEVALRLNGRPATTPLTAAHQRAPGGEP